MTSYSYSENSFPKLAVLIHWLTALLILGSYVTIFGRNWFVEESSPQFLQTTLIHMAIGVSIGAITLLRILSWTWQERLKPELAPMWQLRMAGLSHFLLYGFMIGLPLSGYLMSGSDITIGFINIPRFADTPLYPYIIGSGFDWMSFKKLAYIFHTGSGEYVFWPLIALHGLAAMYHHIILKDETLIRMLPFQGTVVREIRPAADVLDDAIEKAKNTNS